MGGGGKHGAKVPVDPNVEDLLSDEELSSCSGASATSGSASKSQSRRGKRGADAGACRKHSRGRIPGRKRGAARAAASDGEASAEQIVKQEADCADEGQSESGPSGKAATKRTKPPAESAPKRSKQQVVSAQGADDEVEQRTQHVRRAVNMACSSRHTASETSESSLRV